jgi:hypothetical protein
MASGDLILRRLVVYLTFRIDVDRVSKSVLFQERHHNFDSASPAFAGRL